MCGRSRTSTTTTSNEPLLSAEPKEQSSCQHHTSPQQPQEESSEDSLIAHIRQYQRESARDADAGGPSKQPEPSSSSSSADADAHLAQHHPHHQFEDSEQEELHGDENFLVGITPQYWAHVPMLIGDILHNLTLSKGGINFYHKTIPVSKCLLVGRIVAVSSMSDNTIQYVLDDGTGLIDCITYHNNSNNNLLDDYELPSLLPSNDGDDQNDNQNQEHGPIPLGTCVRIFGKIKNLAISHGRVVREVNAQILEPVSESFRNNRPYNPEHEHWIRCVKFYHQACECSATATTTTATTKIFQPLDCLETLGDHIQSQVRAKRRLPSADDTLGAWRIFGISDCQCNCSQSIKDSLLYCHCQSKVILKTDPQFQYKEALLRHLLQNQSKHVKMLVFGYQELKRQESLVQVAMEQASKSSSSSGSSSGSGGNNHHHTTTRQKFFHEELLRATVRSLVKDGILFHIDHDNDQYLLITREKVLEPFVRSELNRNTKNFVSLKGAPKYLNGVDFEKFMYIKRCILAGGNNKDDANQCKRLKS